MARLRARTEPTRGDSVPPELRDPAAACWHSWPMLEAFADELGISLRRLEERRDGMLVQEAECEVWRGYCLTAWGITHGLTSDVYGQSLDHGKLHAAGIVPPQRRPKCPHAGKARR